MTFIGDLWDSIQLSSAFESMIEGASKQVGSLLPYGVMLMGVLAAPRIVKKIIHAFF